MEIHLLKSPREKSKRRGLFCKESEFVLFKHTDATLSISSEMVLSYIILKNADEHCSSRFTLTLCLKYKFCHLFVPNLYTFI